MIGPVRMSVSTSVARGLTSIVAIRRRARPASVPLAAGPGINGNFGTSNNEGIYGFHAGAQWQWGAWVLGAEATLSGCFHECRSTTALGPLGFNANTAGEHKITNLFTAGPRLGYAWDRWMIYATGGWASANLKGTYCSTITGLCGPAAPTSQSGASRNSGWYAGGGLDFMVHKGALVDVILGVEYQQVVLRVDRKHPPAAWVAFVVMGEDRPARRVDGEHREQRHQCP